MCSAPQSIASCSWPQAPALCAGVSITHCLPKTGCHDVRKPCWPDRALWSHPGSLANLLTVCLFIEEQSHLFSSSKCWQGSLPFVLKNKGVGREGTEKQESTESPWWCLPASSYLASSCLPTSLKWGLDSCTLRTMECSERQCVVWRPSFNLEFQLRIPICLKYSR